MSEFDDVVKAIDNLIGITNDLRMKMIGIEEVLRRNAIEIEDLTIRLDQMKGES